ncbi:MAG: DMT family transporter [Clostridia bacterium]|nr:DMT family transporter [Clostridia bacterium]
MLKKIKEKKGSTVIGAFFLVLSAFFFALMSVFVRLSGDLPTFQKAFFRNAVAALIALIMLAKSKDFSVKKGCRIPLLFRSLAGTVGIVCNFYAVDHMNLADASILNKLSPFFAVIFSVIILKEKASKWDWALIALAFSGALFVVKPSFDFASVAPALLGVLGGLGAGIAYAFVRLLGGRGERKPVIVFYFSLFSCLVVTPMFILQYTPMAWWQLLFLLLAGGCAGAAQFSITTAYAYAPAKEISVYDYFQVVFTAILGWTCFGEIPDWLSFIGYAIIIAAAVLKYIKAKKSAKKENNQNNNA